MKNEDLLNEFMSKNNLNYNECFWIKEGNWKVKTKIVKEYDVLKKVNMPKVKCYCDKSWVNTDSEKWLINIMFNENYTIISKKTEPIDGEEVWHISGSGVIYGSIYERHKTDNKAMFLIGNCFETQKEAEENREKILKVLNQNKPLVDLVDLKEVY